MDEVGDLVDRLMGKRKELDDLIEALVILRKYGDTYSPFHCEHDVLQLNSVFNARKMSPEDVSRLEALDFIVAEEHSEYEEGTFYSYRYGKC